MGTIIEVLQWVIPSGAIASVITWLVNRSLYNARSAKEKQDIYKTMYENLHETVLNIQNDYKKINIAFIELERAVSKAVLCKYYDSYCPVRAELQNSKGKPTTKPVGQSADKRNKNVLARSCTTKQSGIDDDTGEPPNIAGRCGVYTEGWTGKSDGN